MAAIFVPGQFEKLHRVLTDAAASPARVAGSNEWYIALDRSAGSLADLARANPPNDAERREIQSGKVVIEGVTHSLNNDFAQQTLLLAQQLDISERYAASLLQAGMQARAKWGRSAIEVGCILYHREKLAAIACLKELVSGAATLQRDDESVEARKLGAKMRQVVDALLVGKTPLPKRILEEVVALKSSIEKTKNALRGIAPTGQPHPTGQPQLGAQAQTSQDAQSRLSDEIQLQRLKMMRRQRQELGHVLYLLSASQSLGSQGIMSLLEWLSTLPAAGIKDPMVAYAVTIVLNALEPPREEEDALGPSLMDDVSFVKQVHQQLTTKTWLPEVRNLILLQWCLFLAEATKRSPSLANELKVHQDNLQKLFMSAVHGDALYYVVLRLLSFRQKEVDALEGEENDPTEMLASRGTGDDSIDDKDDIDSEFQEYILLQVQELVLSLTSGMLPFVRKLQRAEEDASFASSRSGSSDVNRRFDIEALFDIVALLCRARPDSGLSFWLGPEGKGTRFLNWAVEVREPGHQRALFDMLASLSAGRESAWHAHILLSSVDTGSSTSSSNMTPGQLMQQARFVSWSKLFDWMQQYIDMYRMASSQSRGNSSAIMPSNEAVILRSFLRILRNVAFYSIGAREALYQHTQHQVVPRLFTLYSCPTIIEVKAATLDALAAFAHSSGANASKITNQLWTMLENTLGVGMQVSPGQRTNTTSSLPFAVHDLQNVEVPARIFPSTTSLVNLFKALVHVPQRLDQQPIEVLTGASSSTAASQGLALNLGQGHRIPGLEPYIDFVVDNVLISAPTREYADASERWRVTSACLDFLERCLFSFDMSALLSGNLTDGTGLLLLAQHPGFSIMKRILTGSRLLHEILNVLNPNAGVPGAPAGFEIINSERANTLFFTSCVRHSLRIIQRVLQLQEGFLQVLLPTLNDAASSMPLLESKCAQSSLCTPLDTLLLHAHQSVVQTALYVNCSRNDIALLSVRIIGLLASSPAFSDVDKFGGLGYNRKMNRLVGLLEMSEEADRVRAGFVDRLESEADEAGADVDSHVKATLALMKIADQDDDDEQLQQIAAPTLDADEAIRLAILDMLISHTAFHRDAPNIAHLLLGFDLRATRAEEQIVPDADSLDAPPSALHAILDLLRPDPEGAIMPLAQRSPAFAEKCYLLIGNLCRHPFTSTATLRYLRTKENFLSKQLRALSYTPVRRVSSEHGALGTMVQPDGGHLTTTVDALVSSLLIRGHIMSNVALELHTLCSAGLWAEANTLIAVLLGRDSVLDNGDADDDDDLVDDLSDARHFEQRGMRLLEMLQSLDFEWYDARDEDVQEPTILSNLDLSQALSQHPAREYDVRATIHLLAAARHELERRGDLTESRQRIEFDKDASLILKHVSSRNARRAIAVARRIAMQSWRSMLDMTFSRANHLLRAASRANVVTDCLGALLPRLSGASSENDPALADVIAGATLGLFTRLRDHQTDASNDLVVTSELPVDRLVTLLRALLAAITEPGTSMQARGNLYSALINYLQLIKAAPSPDATEAELHDDDAASTLDGASEADDALSYTGFSTVTSAEGSAARKRVSQVESRSRSLLAAQAERLVPIIARDALDAADVWRTVAFALLDRLAALKGSSSSTRTLLLDILGRKGYLKSFVANIREMDVALQETLVPDPPSLNAIYVYEGSMAFFNRLAQSRKGAERLVDARIFDVLSQVDYLQARPQQQYPYAQDDEFDDAGSFLPAITSRYEALLLPALQLSISILSASHEASHRRAFSSFSLRDGSAATPSHAVARQALSFVQAHRSSLLLSLKNATSDTVSLAALEQAQLVVNLLVFVLPVLDDDALSAPKPMSHFHQSVLALSANFLYEPHWQGRVVPHNEVERDEAAQPTSALGEDIAAATVFDSRARDGVERLLVGLLAYLERASELSGVEHDGRKVVRPCLSSSLYTHPSRGVSIADEVGDLSANTVGPGRYGLHGGRAAHISSLGTALASLDESIKRSRETFNSLDKMQSMLDNVDAVRLDEWDDVLNGAAGMINGVAATSVAPAQRKTLAIRLLRTDRGIRRRQLLFHLNSIEMLLTILHRHFAYYVEVNSTPRTSGQSGASSFSVFASLRGSTLGPDSTQNVSITGMPAHELAALVRDGSKITGRVLEKLDDILAWLEGQHGEGAGEGSARHTNAMHPLVPHADERRAFMSITARRLQSIFAERLEDVQ